MVEKQEIEDSEKEESIDEEEIEEARDQENQGFTHSHEEIDTLSSQERFMAPVLEDSGEIQQTSSLEQTAEQAPLTNFNPGSENNPGYNEFSEYKSQQTKYENQESRNPSIDLSFNAGNKNMSLSPLRDNLSEQKLGNSIRRTGNPEIDSMQNFQRLQDSYEEKRHEAHFPIKTRKNNNGL